MMFLIIINVMASIADSTAVQNNTQTDVPQVVAIIISIILGMVTTVLGVKISKFKKISQLIKVLFQDIEDSVIDNKISQTEVKKILNDIINIKQLFK